ncbi:hypothetical protein MX850_08945 [Erysipelothrix sp. Poltava]|nr:hypothetical protein MX850_08945 [Erysipelothrix sp. Poltava]
MEKGSSGDIYKTVVDKTKDILTTGSSYVPGVKVTKAHVDANLKINNNGWWGSSIVVGTTSPHWSPTIITSKTAQAYTNYEFR